MEDKLFAVGPWAKEKLECLRKYLEAYTTIMAKQSSWCQGFIFVDAFAGPGRHTVRPATEHDTSQLFLAELTSYQTADAGQTEYINGSPRVALSLERPFTKYYFTELSPRRLKVLNTLKDEFAGRHAIEVLPIDCNKFLVEQFVSRYNWSAWRAVVFLDPFGKQVPWATIEKLSKTGAVEIFLNLPVWMAIQRFLKRHGRFTESEQETLDEYFGTEEWRALFYVENDTQSDLFGNSSSVTMKVADSGRLLVRWYRGRLRKLFPHVSSARLIKSSRGRNLYCLIHAGHNPTGGRIANEILRQGAVID